MLYELLAELLRDVVSKPFLAMLAVLVAGGFYVRSQLRRMAELHRKVQHELGELRQELEQLRTAGSAVQETAGPLAEPPQHADELPDILAAGSADIPSLQQPPPLPDNLLDRIELPGQPGFEPGQAEPAVVTEQQAEVEPAAPVQRSTVSERATAAAGPNPLWRLIAGGNTLVRVGVLVLFLGLSFLLRYVSEHTQVPVSLRYAGVAATGLALLLAGWRWRSRRDHYGLILQGAGVAVLYLTTLAAMKLHPLLAPQVGFVVLISVAVLGVVLALRQDSLILAWVATLGGFAAPVLASTGAANHLFLFSYLTVINLAVVSMAWFRAWRILNLSGFLCSLALATAWGRSYYEPSLFTLAEPFLLLLFVLYVLAAFLFARRRLAGLADQDTTGLLGGRVSYVDATLVFGVPLSVFGLQYLMTRHWDYGPAWSALGFGLAYAVLAWLLFRNTGRRYALLSETMVALSLVFCSLSIPLAFDGEWTSAGWAIEAAGLYWVGMRQQHRTQRLFALLLMLGSVGWFVLGLRVDAAGGSLVQGSWLGCVLLLLVCGLTGWLMRRAPAGQLSGIERQVQPALLVLASVLPGLLGLLVLPVLAGVAALAVTGLLALGLARRLGAVSPGVAGLLLQLLAGLLYWRLAGLVEPAWNANEWAPLLIALCGFASAWRLSRSQPQYAAMAAVLLGWALCWWVIGWGVVLGQRLGGTAMLWQAWLALVLCTAWAGFWLERRLDWQQLGRTTVLLLPALCLIFLAQLLDGGALRLLAGWNAVLWPLALVTHLYQLQRAQRWLGTGLVKTLHVAGCWLFVLLLVLQVQAWLADWAGKGSVWAVLAGLPVAVLFILSLGRSRHWPYAGWQRLYAGVAALPVVLVLLGYTLLLAFRGEASGGFPYLPVFNALEISQLLVLASIGYWWRRALQPDQRGTFKPLMLIFGVPVVFVVLSAMVVRACSYWGAVPWSYQQLSASMLVQSSLSIAWGVAAIGIMLWGHRKVQRGSWMGGAALMALVVGKLFLVELSASGSLERIVSFLAVGGLLLVVGYFAPLPPRRLKTEG